MCQRLLQMSEGGVEVGGGAFTFVVISLLLSLVANAFQSLLCTLGDLQPDPYRQLNKHTKNKQTNKQTNLSDSFVQ